jgi:uncharacterized protein
MTVTVAPIHRQRAARARTSPATPSAPAALSAELAAQAPAPPAPGVALPPGSSAAGAAGTPGPSAGGSAAPAPDPSALLDKARAPAPAPLLPPLPPGAQRGSRRKGIAFEKSKCGSCIALCCRYFALEVDRPTVPSDFENLRWYLLHARVNVFVEGRRWYVQIFNTCQALGPDNKCTIYEKRPGICRQYDNDVCDKDEALGDSTSDQLFRTVGELESYRDAWIQRYKARQRRERRAAAAKRARRLRRKPAARHPARPTVRSRKPQTASRKASKPAVRKPRD